MPTTATRADLAAEAARLSATINRDMARMTARLARHGRPVDECAEVLAEHVAAHDCDNLAAALLHLDAASPDACQNHANRRARRAEVLALIAEADATEAAEAEAAGCTLDEWRDLDACDRGQRADAAAYALAEAWAAEIDADLERAAAEEPTEEEPAEITEARAALAIRDDLALHATCSHHLDALLAAMGATWRDDLAAAREAAAFAGLAAWHTATAPILERLSLYLDEVEERGLSHPRRVRAALGAHAMPLLAACLEVEARLEGLTPAEVLADCLASAPEGRERPAAEVQDAATLDDLAAHEEIAETTAEADAALEALAAEVRALHAATAAPAADLLEGLGA